MVSQLFGGGRLGQRQFRHIKHSSYFYKPALAKCIEGARWFADEHASTLLAIVASGHELLMIRLSICGIDFDFAWALLLSAAGADGGVLKGRREGRHGGDRHAGGRDSHRLSKYCFVEKRQLSWSDPFDSLAGARGRRSDSAYP